MQTFLPYPDFFQSLSCLDDKRLGKQRVEAYQLLTLDRASRWWNHPAKQMWLGYEEALTQYYNLSLIVWTQRGFRNVMLSPLEIARYVVLPPWIGDTRLHASHRSNLLRKKPEYYMKFNWTESPNLPYFWPILSKKVIDELLTQ